MKSIAVSVTMALGLLSGCSSTQQAPSISLVGLSVGTYALFSFQIEGLSKMPQCTLVLSQKGTTEKVIYKLPKGSKGLIPLKPGTYSYDHFDCGLERKYLVANPFGKKQNAFSVLASKINYLGHTTLSFDSKDDLKLRFDQADHHKEIKRVFESLPQTEWAANNIVSTYTQRSIRHDMMVHDLPRSFSMKSRAPKEEQDKLKTLLAAIQTKIGKCAELEAKANPLKVGALVLTYTLKNGVFEEQQKRETHVYSKTFGVCVNKAMTSTRHAADYELSIDMAL